MSAINCTCDNPEFGHAGRPDCVITMNALAFPVFSPKLRANGNENFLPANAAGIVLFNAEYVQTFTTLAECVDYRLSALAAAQDRLYPLLKVENGTFDRTDTVYDTAPSGRKIRLQGVGGIRTFAFELWDKDAVFGVARALKKFGCTDLTVHYIDVAGNNWGIQDDSLVPTQRGYLMDTGTFDSFIGFPTDTTTNKIMISFDLDRFECEENSWAITAEEYGKSFTSIRPLVQGVSVLDVANSTLVAAAAITIVAELSADFGTAGNKSDIVGLLSANFELLDPTGAVEIAAGSWDSVTENPNGTYTLVTTPVISAGDYSLVSLATGYFVPNLTIPVA